MTDRTEDDRPSPDALLEQAKTDSRGRLKIFLGAAPGVGKTYAMLTAGQSRRREGLDIVVGVAETHGRRETEALVRGLEIVPRRAIEYRGLPLQEMDLDAILKRKPKLVLVDELAHTNIPGSRHPKRYQDVEELLDAGIDVYSTLNIQHLESLNDVVARIANVRVRETIPDSVLQKAAEIEVIDLAPQELLQRLNEGKVYVPEQARRAMHHFFSPGNLTALRELALRHAAERVDEQMLSYMRTHAIQGPWPTRERIMVCVGGDPAAARLVRTAKRTAERRNAPWLAVYVETHRHRNLSEEAKDRTSSALRLAEQLGGETAVLIGEDITQELIGCARARNVSMIIVGKPRRSRWRAMLRRSLPDDLLARARPFDILVVSGDDGEKPAKVARLERSIERSGWVPYALAALGVAGATAIAWVVQQIFDLPNASPLYLLIVLLIAIRFGLWPSIAASALSFIGYNALFTEPAFSFNFGHQQPVFAIVFFLLVAVISSNLSTRLRNQVDASKRSARRTANLYDFSRKIAGAANFDDVLWAVVYHVAATLQGRALILMQRDAQLEIVAGYPPEDQLDAAAAAAADWTWRQGKPAGRGSSTLPSSAWLFLPLRTVRGPVGVLGVQIEGKDKLLSPEQSRLLDALADQAAVALERSQLAADIEHARIQAEAERMRGALLSSISHDLRTPLAAITGTATNLAGLWESYDDATRQHLVQSIRDQAERLNRFVQNLADMTRLGTGALSPKREWIEVSAIVASALQRIRKRTEGHAITVDIGSPLPLIHVDYMLIEQVLINILDNACKFSPPNGPIVIRAQSADGRVLLRVFDRGTGIPEAERERVFDMFYRVNAGDGRSNGLGLAICRGIVEAHGGTVTAESGENGVGTCIQITFAAGSPPPADAADTATDTEARLSGTKATPPGKISQASAR
ncbi:MAG: sensor histidine kinase KdpD [Azospirillaceae bacterium]|nr:sensor histidine kinase KdpD [Azospirillaceae bacterium]